MEQQSLCIAIYPEPVSCSRRSRRSEKPMQQSGNKEDPARAQINKIIFSFLKKERSDGRLARAEDREQAHWEQREHAMRVKMPGPLRKETGRAMAGWYLVEAAVPLTRGAHGARGG